MKKTNDLSVSKPSRRLGWDPFGDLSIFGSRLEKLLGPMLPEGAQGTGTEWCPLVDITEDENEFMVKVELPDLKKEEVKVTMDNGNLTISGERKREQEERGRTYHRIERSYGTFQRSFTLPAGVESSKIAADFQDGILKVHLPKDENVKPRAIAVQVA